MPASNPFILGLKASIPDAALTATDALYNQVGHNTGNLAFHHAIDAQFGGGLPVRGWHAPLSEINSGGGIALLPCANQLGSHLDYGSLASKFSQIERPIVAIGLGAQAGTDGKIPDVPKGTLDWVRAIVERAPGKAPSIGVRGPFTLKVLEHYGLGDRVAVTGCPTLFINPAPNLGQLIASRIREPRRVAVAAGHQRWMHLAKIEASLVRIANATAGSYVGQSPLEMVALTRGEAAALPESSLRACRDYAAPEMSLDEFARWTAVHGNVFFDIPAWMEHYRRFDFVVGTRIHGVMLALQAGVPAMCIAHDSRTIELCEFMAVPHVRASSVSGGLSRDQLLTSFKFDAAEFDNRRAQIARTYSDFLHANGLKPASKFGLLRAIEANTSPMPKSERQSPEFCSVNSI